MTTKLSHKLHTNEAIRHCEELAKLAGYEGAVPDYELANVGRGIYLRLHRIEATARRNAELECNGPEWNRYTQDYWPHPTEKQFAKRDRRATKAVADALNMTVAELESLGFFINGDPRGCALKIESDTQYLSYHDWGGYQLLAPEF